MNTMTIQRKDAKTQRSQRKAEEWAMRVATNFAASGRPSFSHWPTFKTLRSLRLCAFALKQGCLKILLLSLLPLSASAADLPARFTAIYDVKKGPITIGETRRTLMPDGPNRFVFESVTRPTGVSRLLRSGQVVERSRWTWHGRHLRPLEYTWFSRGGERPRTLHLKFDWSQRKLTNTVNGDPWQMPLTDDLTVDKLLFQLRLMHDLPTTQRRLRYPVADGGKLKMYDLEILGVETIRIPSGTYQTVRVRRSNGPLQTTFWCARKLHYLPVRIERRRADGSTINAVLTSVAGF